LVAITINGNPHPLSFDDIWVDKNYNFDTDQSDSDDDIGFIAFKNQENTPDLAKISNLTHSDTLRIIGTGNNTLGSLENNDMRFSISTNPAENTIFYPNTIRIINDKIMSNYGDSGSGIYDTNHNLVSIHSSSPSNHEYGTSTRLNLEKRSFIKKECTIYSYYAALDAMCLLPILLVLITLASLKHIIKNNMTKKSSTKSSNKPSKKKPKKTPEELELHNIKKSNPTAVTNKTTNETTKENIKPDQKEESKIEKI
jgi:hypothetical protein